MTGSTVKRRVTIAESQHEHDASKEDLNKPRSKSIGSKMQGGNSPRNSSFLESVNEDQFSENLEPLQVKKGSRGDSRERHQVFQEKLAVGNSMEVDDAFEEEDDQFHDLDDWADHLQNLYKEIGKGDQRTAMGEYITTNGTKPLTQLALQTPGPSDYCPKVVLSRPSAPHYSIVGKPKYVQEYSSPGPNKYKIDKDLIWRDKTITLKGKGAIDGSNKQGSNGSAIYNVTHGNLGTIAPKHTIGRQMAICSGPPNSLVQAVDTFGFHTPGPAEYRPKSGYWANGMKKSFGLKPPKKELMSTSPGPAEYNIPSGKPYGPLPSFGMRLNENIGLSSNTPGPGAYQIGTTIGKSVAKSIASRPAIKNNDNTPSPNTYLLPSSIGNRAMHTMTYRPFETIVKPSPGPTEYEPKNDNVRKGPEFTCGRRCPLGYPDALHHWDHARNLNPNVAPDSYNPNQDFAKNDKPSYSMGKRFKQNAEDSPGPASYNISGVREKSRKMKQAFSIGKRIEQNIVKYGPGPAAYNPKPTKSGPSYSMSGWNRKKQGAESDHPAANKYTVDSNQTRTGKSNGPAVTLKGRPSPFVYSGFRRPLQI